MLNFERTINLKTDVHNSTYSDYAPLKLTVDPRSLEVANKIHRIEYIFDNLETRNQNLFFTASATNGYPFPKEVGDPRHYPQIKTFYLPNKMTHTYGITANVYQIGLTTPTKITFKLNLSAPKMDGEILSVFTSVNLIYTRMFGVNNDILYVFETTEPNYYIPLIINWTSRPVIVPEIIIDKGYRPYKIFEPYENQMVSNGFEHIDFINKQHKYDSDPTYPNCKPYDDDECQ